MRELRLENQLKHTQSMLEYWSDRLRNGGDIKNITEWMLQESNQIQILLKSNETH